MVPDASSLVAGETLSLLHPPFREYRPPTLVAVSHPGGRNIIHFQRTKVTFAQTSGKRKAAVASRGGACRYKVSSIPGYPGYETSQRLRSRLGGLQDSVSPHGISRHRLDEDISHQADSCSDQLHSS